MNSIITKIADSKSPTPNQSEIIGRWQNPELCKVSICMLVYNHEEFLEESINSILSQRTNFAFELLIHDDASTDNSQAIIKKFEKLYPSIIKPTYQTKNQHSQGINPSVHFNYPRATGDYIALCEGDDYWSDPFKLKIQTECLDQNKEINLCFHLAQQISYFHESKPTKTIGCYAEQDGIIPFEKILFLTNGMVPTASCMIRSHVKKDLIAFMKERPHLTLGDRFLQFFGAYPNGAYYINRSMSVYRLGTQHSWSASISKNPEHKVRHEKVMLLAFTELNKTINNALSNQIAIIYLQRLLWFFSPKKDYSHPLNPTILDTLKQNTYPSQDLGIKTLEEKFLVIQKEIFQTLKKWNEYKGGKIIYGAGSGCNLVINTLGSLNISAIIDRDKKSAGEEFNKTPIISTTELVKYKNPLILVSIPSAQKKELNSELESYGIDRKNIHYLFDSSIDWLSKNPLSDDELKTIYESIFIHKKTY